MAYLQVLSIGGNRLTGNLRPDTFVNKTELETLDISNNGFTGALPDLNPLKTKLKYLDVSGNQFEGQLPNLTQFSLLSTANFGGNAFFLAGNDAPLLDILWNGVAQNSALTTLNLSYNQLTGPLSSWNFSPSLGSVQSLLYLDNNKLSGTLDISKMLAWGLLEERLSFGSTQNVTGRRLNTMSLRNNNISHVVSDPYAIANTTTLFILQGNPYCDNYNSKDDAQRCYCTQYCYATPASLQEDRRKITIIAAVISVLAVVFILLLVVGAILYKNRRYKLYLQLEVQKKFEEFDVKPTIFSYNELRTATQDFHEDMKLGQGSYGAVYKGVLPNGNAVAVKQLYARATQGMDEFLNEVILITGMKHRNLVNLKGCCVRDNQRLLVYEYVDNFDVNQILLERGSRRKVVNWPTRLKICLGIAQGLQYLHALAHPRVIHRDIKASNVLLDKNLTPKIADFGLVLLFPDEETHIMTVHVAGTKGYLAPEYASYGQLSDKVDVFSFGVLCLEIISGRRNIDETKPQDQVYLAQWAWQLHEEGKLIELVDSTLQLTDEETVRDVQRVIDMCLMCIQTGAEKRPTMATIVSILQSSDGAQVLAPAAKDDKRPHFESIFESTLLRSQESVNFMSTSVMEEDGSSSREYRAKSLSPRFSQRRRGGAVEMKEITTVGREGSSDPMLL
uniref:Leucine-rich repeat receptor-like protein kinase n=1 Tax=Pohlia nutans TaxID=140635 RepID=A0A1P8DYW5_9BRYO|nr:leucine-rich repeat receptor-like protein kinase [Pohlia nutans]